MASNYEQLVESLRLCQFGECGCGKCYYKELKGDWCTEDNHPEFFDCDDKLKLDAASAIEALQEKVNQAEKRKTELLERNEELELKIDMLTADCTNYEIFIDELKAAQPHWVSVKERLPDKPGLYLVAYYYWADIKKKNHKVGLDSWRGKTTWARHDNRTVTHWMPLPEPPQEES